MPNKIWVWLVEAYVELPEASRVPMEASQSTLNRLGGFAQTVSVLELRAQTLDDEGARIRNELLPLARECLKKVQEEKHALFCLRAHANDYTKTRQSYCDKSAPAIDEICAHWKKHGSHKDFFEETFARKLIASWKDDDQGGRKRGQSSGEGGSAKKSKKSQSGQ